MGKDNVKVNVGGNGGGLVKRESALMGFDSGFVLDMFQEYVIYVGDNPDVRHEAIKSGERAGELIEIPVPIPLTVVGFCNFTSRFYGSEGMGISKKLFFDGISMLGELELKRRNGQLGKGEDVLYDVVLALSKIKDMIEENQLAGGMNGQFNTGLVSKVLGLDNVDMNARPSEMITIVIGGKPLDLK